ncbi:MAG: glycosyltransferase [Crocinitomicaceae bacterium]
MAKKVICFGPGTAFKGGIANYNVSLAKAMDKIGCDTEIISWTQQYPAIVPREFKDNTSKKNLLEGTKVTETYITNYNKMSTWKQTANLMIEKKPDVVVIQWYNAQQGWPLGKIAQWLKKAGVRVFFDLHFVVPKENSKIDRFFTQMGLNKVDNFIVHALSTYNELKALFPDRNFKLIEKDDFTEKDAVIKLYHPVYDLFEPDPNFDIAAYKKEHHLQQNVFLYFGFIRKYKGLHNVIKAYKKVADQREDVSLIICGESFWNTLDTTKFSTKVKNFIFGIVKKLFMKKEDDEKDYRPLDLINELNLQDRVMLMNEFVPNEEVHKYFQVADVGLLFYLRATPSGVESLNYNFKLPVIATSVGHFPETIENGINGYLAEPENLDDMASKMIQSIEKPINRENIAQKTKEMSWENYAKAIVGL